MPKSNYSMKLPTTVPLIAVRTRFVSTTTTSSTSRRGSGAGRVIGSEDGGTG